MSARGLSVWTAMVVAVAAWAAPVPFERTLPEETIFYMNVASVPRFVEKAGQAGFLAALEDPQLQRFLEKPKEALAKAVQDEFGMTLSDVGAIFHGQALLAVTLEAPAEGELKAGVFVLLETGPRGGALMGIMQRLQEKILAEDEKVFERVEDDEGGVRIIGWMPLVKEGEAAKADEARQGFHYALAKDVFVAGTPLSAVKAALRHLADPPASALVNTENHTRTMQRVGSDLEGAAFLDLAAIMRTVKPKEDPLWPAKMRALGLDTLLGAGAGFAFQERSSVTRMFLRTTGEKRGVSAILAPEPGPLMDAGDIPSDVQMFGSMRLSLKTIWAEARKIATAFFPPFEVAYQQQMAKLSEQLGQPFDVGKDVVAVFGDRVSMYQSAAAGGEDGDPQAVLIVDVVSREAFEGLWAKLGRLAPFLSQMVVTQDYLGQTLYAFKRPGGEEGAAGTPLPAFCVLEDRLVFGARREETERYLRFLNGKGESLKDVAAYQQAMAALPAEGWTGMAYADQRKGAKGNADKTKEAWAMVRDRLQQGMEDAPAPIKAILEAVDWDQAPPMDALAGYQDVGSACLQTVEDGLLLVGVSIPGKAAAK
ncbi:MAG TPA: hypothetical protein P5137_12690 [Candidatus Brocadiia bacterium]|nr:hypothetical protein [Candidatus Brocadiia bacterium]